MAIDFGRVCSFVLALSLDIGTTRIVDIIKERQLPEAGCFFALGQRIAFLARTMLCKNTLRLIDSRSRLPDREDLFLSGLISLSMIYDREWVVATDPTTHL